MNLLANAIKFTVNGDVRIEVHADRVTGKPLRIDVIDSGIGIPAGRIAAIFDPFQQADNTTSRKYGGTGLGLTTCRSLAQLLGFEIAVTSEEGVGSTFSVIVAAERAEGQVRVESVIAKMARSRRTNARGVFSPAAIAS